jgi:HAD superfamily hydrolase (TIGR01662 family)
VIDAGFRIVPGRRRITHPVRPADRWVSVRLQAGNADDVLMRVVHGPEWRELAGVPRGRRGRHAATVAAAGVAIAGLTTGRRGLTAAGALGWLIGTAELAWARIAPGPRTRDEVTTMLATSAVLPFAATWHWVRAWGRILASDLCRRITDAGGIHRNARKRTSDRVVRAVLFDRDGTIVVDVPYNGDPDRVVPMPGAREAIARVRAAGLAVGVVSNQSGIARGLLTRAQVDAVNERIDARLGPLDAWVVCPHGPDEGCACRKPAPGMIREAAARLRVAPEECVVIGDTGADVDAARAAGARAVLVPNAVTRREEIEQASEVAPDLASAVARILDRVAVGVRA